MVKKYMIIAIWFVCSMGLVAGNDKINISGLDRVDVLKSLYQAASGQSLSYKKAKQIIESCRGDIDYLGFTPMKVYLGHGITKINVRLFNRDNGEGVAQRAIAGLRAREKAIRKREMRLFDRVFGLGGM